MSIFLYVDNSNVWIEGSRVSYAKNNNISITDAIKKNLSDNAWRIDFGQLLNILAESNKLEKAMLFGSKPPENDSLWEEAKKKGFEPFILDRNASNKEKGVDIKMALEISDDLHIAQKGSKFIIVSGDADYIPIIERVKNEEKDYLKGKEYMIEVAFWGHATASKLKTSADKFIDLANSFNLLTWKQK